jgi:cell volume regulation protein A
VSPKDLITLHVFIPGLILSFFLIFIARPLAVWLTMWTREYSAKEKIFISWVGLRGAAPIMLATFPLAANIDHAPALFNMIFFMVITSMIIQAPTIMPLARYLGIAAPSNDKQRVPLELEMTAASLKYEMFEFEVSDDAQFVDLRLSELGLPKGVLVMLIRRGDTFIQPNGNTKIKEKDGLIVMGEHELMQETHQKFFPDIDYQPVRTYSEIRSSINSKMQKAFSLFGGKR